MVSDAAEYAYCVEATHPGAIATTDDYRPIEREIKGARSGRGGGICPGHLKTDVGRDLVDGYTDGRKDRVDGVDQGGDVRTLPTKINGRYLESLRRVQWTS